MGARKRLRAEERKEANKSLYIAKLKDVSTSPLKMRLVADLIRGKKVEKALQILKFSKKHTANRIEKLLLSAVSNWQAKNSGVRLEDSELFVKELFVDGAKTLRRLRPAPQGRGYRIRKRSNHVTLILDSLNKAEVVTENQQ